MSARSGGRSPAAGDLEWLTDADHPERVETNEHKAAGLGLRDEGGI
jgi:hypothetical protein